MSDNRWAVAIDHFVPGRTLEGNGFPELPRFQEICVPYGVECTPRDVDGGVILGVDVELSAVDQPTALAKGNGLLKSFTAAAGIKESQTIKATITVMPHTRARVVNR